MKTLKIKHKFVLMSSGDIALAIYSRIIVKNFLFSIKKGVAKLDNRRASSPQKIFVPMPLWVII